MPQPSQWLHLDKEMDQSTLITWLVLVLNLDFWLVAMIHIQQIVLILRMLVLDAALVHVSLQKFILLLCSYCITNKKIKNILFF